MSIDAVKSIQPYTVAQKNKTPFTSQPEVQTKDIKNGKVLLMASLAALGAIGIYIATRGKKGHNEIATEIQKPVEQIKDMAIDAFKQAGNKFEKGVAKLSNGENYTGKLTQQLDDGKVSIREYKDGILQTAKKMEGESVISSKTYNYDNDGDLTKILDEQGRILFEKRTIGNCTRIDTKNVFCILEDNALKYCQDNKTGKIFAYDDQGKVSGIIHSYNAGTKRVGRYTYETSNGLVLSYDSRYQRGQYADTIKEINLYQGDKDLLTIKKQQQFDKNRQPRNGRSYLLDSEEKRFQVCSDGTILKRNGTLDEDVEKMLNTSKKIKALHKKALKIISDLKENNNIFYPKA